MDNVSNLPSTSFTRALGELPRLSRRDTALLTETIARLMSHYWTADDHPAARQAQIEDWLEDLSEFGLDVARLACADWRQSQTRRPTPADIRRIAVAEWNRRNPQPPPVYLPEPPPLIEDETKRAEMAARAAGLANLMKAGLVPEPLIGPQPKRGMSDEERDAYIAGRLEVPGQRELSREEADAALANLRMSFGLPPETPPGEGR
jgi:hypothetical protein